MCAIFRLANAGRWSNGRGGRFHVTHVHAKLGGRSRAELAAQFHDNELAGEPGDRQRRTVAMTGLGSRTLKF